MWNPHYYKKLNTKLIEKCFNISKLFINNNPDFAIHPSSPKMSIIDLALTSPKLSLLCI